MMDGTDRMDERSRNEGDLEQLLRAYAGARLSPDQWASVRMRAAVIEHGRTARTVAARRLTWRRILRPALIVGLVAVLAVGTGASAAFAASPGGPLYGARLWIEGTVLSLNGGTTQLRVDQMDERVDEITNAVDDGNASAADAAASAYGNEVDAAAQSAQTRADLLDLRATIMAHLQHWQGVAHAGGKAQANLDRLISKAVAAIADIDRKLAALPAPSSAP